MCKGRKYRVLSWVLTVVMLFGMVVTPVSATSTADTDAAIVEQADETIDETNASTETSAEEAASITEVMEEIAESQTEGTVVETNTVIEASKDSAADAVQTLINSLPGADEVAAMDLDGQNEVYTAFLTACEAYDALNEDEQAQVDDSALDELAEYFNETSVTIEGIDEGAVEGGEIPVEEDTVEIQRDGYTISAPSIGDLIDEVEDGETITLISDTDTDTYGTANIISSNVIIDLAGYTLDENITIASDASVTIMDSSDSGTGAYTGTLTVSGTLTITGGTYSFDVSSYVAEGYTYNQNINGTYTVIEGTAEYAAQNTTTGAKYETLQAAIRAASNGETIQPLQDLNEDITIESGKVLTIDLAGYTLTGLGTESVITVNGTLTIKDSGTSGTITGGSAAEGGGIYVNEGNLTLEGGTVSGNSATKCGGGIYVSNGSLTISGGTVSQNTVTATGSNSADGGGVYITDSSTFSMTAGKISSNSCNSEAFAGGGGLYVAGSSAVSLTMTGGKISNNTISGSMTYGGGVCLYSTNSGTVFTMSGGEISGNSTNATDSSTDFGGGVCVMWYPTFTISGSASITGNSAANGGGICLALGTVNLNGGSITNNTATQAGGGVLYNANSSYSTSMTASGSPVVTGNKVGSSENNLYIYPDRYITLTGALTEDANIGVTTKTDPTADAPVQITTAETETSYYESSVSYFGSDAGYTVHSNEGKYIELTVEQETFTVYYGETSYEISIDKDKTYDLTQAYSDTLGYGISSGYLYGGVFSDADYTTVVSGCGSGVDFTPEAGETYYVKLVSDSYFRVKCLYSYIDNHIHSLWPILGIDSADYQEYGFLITGSGEGSITTTNEVTSISSETAYNTITIELEGYDSTSVTCNEAFNIAGYLGVLKLESDDLSNYKDDSGTISLTIQPYYVTLDGVMVTGVISRTVIFTNGYAGADMLSSYTDTTVTSTTSKYDSTSDGSSDEDNEETESAEATSQTVSLAATASSRSALTSSVASVSAVSAGTTITPSTGSGSGTSALPGGLNIEDEYVILDVTYVAKRTMSGGVSKQYESLADAFADAQDGDTITLLSDVTITDAEYNGDGYYQVSGKEVTLDLGGYTLSVDTTRILGVKNGGTLNVQNGTIAIAEGTTSTYKQFNMVRGNSTFTTTDVTFEANSIGSYAVYIASGAEATVEMTNCVFENLANAVVFDADNASTVTLTGCTYDKQPFSTSTFSTVDNYTVVIDKNSPTDSGYEYNNNYTLFFNYVIANGGSVNTSSTISLSTYFGESSLTVEEGGSVSANVKINDNTSMTVAGGTVNGTITVAKEGSSESEIATVSEDSAYTVTGGLLTITGGTVTGQIKSSGTLIMSDGIVTDGGTGYSDGVIYILAGNVYVSGGTVTGTKRGFGFAGSGTISGTITGGSFTGSDIALMVRANSSNTVTVSGGSFTATNALYLSQDGMIADNYEVYNTEGSAVSYTMSGSVYLYKSSLSDKTVVVNPITVTLGVSSDSDVSVVASVGSGYGTSTMYVKVDANDMSTYSISAYPTTVLTFSDEEDEAHSYIFAGWYEDSEGNTACTSVPTNADAYAKFVDADTLRVLCVYTPGSLSATGNNALRFLTSLDSLDCQDAGFIVNDITYACTGYASSCTVSNSSMNRTFTKSDISAYANYLLTYRIYVEKLADSYSVCAYWVTADGTTVYGAELTFSSSFLNAAYVLGE